MDLHQASADAVYENNFTNDKACAPEWGNATIIGVLNDALLNRPIEVAWGRNREDREFVTKPMTVGRLTDELCDFKHGPKEGRCLLQGALVTSRCARTWKNITKNYLLMMDFDTGRPVEDVVTQIERQGLFAFVHTTHSHMKCESAIPEQGILNFAKRKGYKVGHVADIGLELILEYLRADKKYEPEILTAAELLPRKHMKGGIHFVVKHAPMPRVRAMFVLQEPFDFANRGGSHLQAKEEWEALYAGFAELLGLPYDTSCTDPSRLMYTPRIAEAADITQHRMHIIAGRVLDLSTVEPVYTKNGSGNDNPFTRAANAAGATSSGSDVPTELRQFAAKYSDFQAAEWMLSAGWTSRHDHPNGMDTECPNFESHSTGDPETERACRILNADGENGWHMLCLHDGCKQASKEDRLWYLQKAMEVCKATVEDLKEFSALACAERDKAAADAKWLEDAIAALSKDTTDSDLDKICEALAKLPEGLTVDRVVTEVVEKSGRPKADIKRHIKRHRNAYDMARKAGANNSSSNDDKEECIARGVVKSSWTHNEQYNAIRKIVVRENSTNPRLFRRPEGGSYVRMNVIEDHPRIAQMNHAGMTHEINGRVEYRVFNKLFESENSHQIPKEMITRFIGTGDLEFPVFERIVKVPVFDKDGKLQTQHGYNAKLKTVVWPNFECLPVPDVITLEHLQEAVTWIKEASRDFPFSDAMNGDDPLPVKIGEPNEQGYHEPNWERGKASRANFTAALLQTFVRDIIGDGPTPNYHIDKPDIGTGADFLRDVISIIINGERCMSQPLPDRNDELQKVMTATLRTGADIIPFNNINRKVASGQLASALTSGMWRDRVLGVSEMVQVPIRCLWIMDGNNVGWSHEMLRRNVPIRIDAATESPSRDRRVGRDFKYELHAWLKANRPKLVWACHVVVGNWVQQGMKRGSAHMASFEDYAGVMSGIFEAAGEWTNFLGNVPDYIQHKDTEAIGGTAFLQKVWDTYKGTAATIAEWLSVAKGPFDIIMDAVPVSNTASEHGQLVAMGAFTNELEGKVKTLVIERNDLLKFGPALVLPSDVETFSVKVKVLKSKSIDGQKLTLKPIELASAG